MFAMWISQWKEAVAEAFRLCKQCLPETKPRSMQQSVDRAVSGSRGVDAGTECRTLIAAFDVRGLDVIETISEWT